MKNIRVVVLMTINQIASGKNTQENMDMKKLMKYILQIAFVTLSKILIKEIVNFIKNSKKNYKSLKICLIMMLILLCQGNLLTKLRYVVANQICHMMNLLSFYLMEMKKLKIWFCLRIEKKVKQYLKQMLIKTANCHKLLIYRC